MLSDYGTGALCACLVMTSSQSVHPDDGPVIKGPLAVMSCDLHIWAAQWPMIPSSYTIAESWALAVLLSCQMMTVPLRRFEFLSPRIDAVRVRYLWSLAGWLTEDCSLQSDLGRPPWHLCRTWEDVALPAGSYE